MIFKVKKTDTIDEISSSEFLSIRMYIANKADEKFGKLYAQTCGTLAAYTLTDSQLKELTSITNKELNEFVKKNKISVKIAKFCYLPDSSGRIPHGTCRALLKFVSEVIDTLSNNTPDYLVKFKDLLSECVKEKSDLIWGESLD